MINPVSLRRFSALVLAAFLAGCATAPIRPRPAVHSFLDAHRVVIGSESFLPTSAISSQLKGESVWDPEAQVLALTVGAHELRVAPQMSVVLVDRVPHPISTPPILEKGELFLPESVFKQWLAGWTPSVPPSKPVAPRPWFQKIILDAGHGGHDPGALGRIGLREKSVTLDIARRLRDLLAKDGFRVVMTRDTDRFISLSRRSDLANREEGDLFISIHANASRRRSISGFEVYTLSDATDDHARAIEAAENASLPADVGEAVAGGTEAIVWDLLYTEHRAESTELAAAVCRGLSRSQIPSWNRGVKSARFAVLKGARMPAILVEVGFITHPEEEARLRNSEYRQRLAEGVRQGILAFQKAYERRS